MSTRSPFTAELMTSTETSAQIWRLSGKMVGESCCYEFLDEALAHLARD